MADRRAEAERSALSVVSTPWEVSFIKRGEGVVDRVGVLKNMTGDSEALPEMWSGHGCGCQRHPMPTHLISLYPQPKAKIRLLTLMTLKKKAQSLCLINIISLGLTM